LHVCLYNRLDLLTYLVQNSFQGHALMRSEVTRCMGNQHRGKKSEDFGVRGYVQKYGYGIQQPQNFFYLGSKAINILQHNS